MLDYIIVGQGIAGSAMAWELRRRGKTFVVIDNVHSQSSSAVAGGDVNPITGKRFVKTWRIADLLSAMQTMYGAMAQQYGQPIWLPRPILRVLHNAKQENDWLARTALPEWQGWVGEGSPMAQAALQVLKGAFATANILQGGKVDMAAVMQHTAAMLQKTGSLRQAKFEYSALQISPESVEYQLDTEKITAHKIIFCEGWQGIHNPFFNYLPFQLSKGEALLVRFLAPYPFADFLVKNDVMIALMPGGNYWVGATNVFEYADTNPTASALTELTERLQAAISLPFEVLEHRACLRPTVLDRRPFVGQHPIWHNLFILNGLGTKGASLAPLLAMELAAAVEDGVALVADIDIARYADLQS